MPPDGPEGTVEDAAARQGRLLLAYARRAIELALGIVAPGGDAELDDAAAEPWLRAPGATFVTLQRGGRLRGCIGSVLARRPLLEDVRANARAAALSDPRFPPLAAGELPGTTIEVSLLSPSIPLPAVTEEEALANLRPGIDGLILEHSGDAQATFLPQVWEALPVPRDFLAHLKRKAGLPADFWSDAIHLRRYTVRKWSE